MINTAFKTILLTIRALIKNRGSLSVFAALYALLLATLYGFIATREATIGQILLTLLFAAASPVVFFLLQAVIINRTRHGRIEWYRALRDSCKLALLALPLILAGVLIASLLNRLQAHFPAPHISQPLQVATTPPAGAVPQPTHWPTVLFATLRSLLFGIVLPLTLIRLWIELGHQDLVGLVRSGWRSLLKQLGSIISRAFEPRSFLIYSAGLIVFALIPYLLLFVHLPLPGAWKEISIFTVRLALVFAFTLLGWVMTLSTLAQGDGTVVIEMAGADTNTDE